MDQSAFSNTQAMTAFTRKFGYYSPSTKTYTLGTTFEALLNGLPYIGFGSGLIFGTVVSRRYGRRICIYGMCAWAIVAAIILVTSESRTQVLVGRVITNVYIGSALAVVPVLLSELVPGQVRGLAVGTYQSCLLVGQLIQSVICRGTSSIEGDASWRIPYGLFFVVPSILMAGAWYMPESPRWLLMRNEPEEAMVSLRLLRQGRFSEDEMREEFDNMRNTLGATAEKGRWAEIFEGSNRKRTLIVIGVNIFLQITGSGFVSLYGTLFIKSLGTINAFSMTCINNSINICTTILTQFLTDTVGRRPLMITSVVIQTGGLMTMGGLGTISNPSMSVKRGITAMVTVFGFAGSLGWGPLSHAVASEVPTTRLRDMTYGIGALCNITTQFLVAFCTPYLLNAPYAALGSKVGFIYGSFAFLGILFSYFCIPECSGKTLEEIDGLFLDGVPIRKFGETKPRLLYTNNIKDDSIKGTLVEAVEV